LAGVPKGVFSVILALRSTDFGSALATAAFTSLTLAATFGVAEGLGIFQIHKFVAIRIDSMGVYTW
jgi:hypothetical protein